MVYVRLRWQHVQSQAQVVTAQPKILYQNMTRDYQAQHTTDNTPGQHTTVDQCYFLRWSATITDTRRHQILTGL
jgi:hypothetical protein